MGCYIAPDDASTIEDVAAAIIRDPRGDGIWVSRDFNAKLEDLEGTTHTEEISAALSVSGLQDMNAHFLTRRNPFPRGGRTWSMLLGGQ